MRKRSKYSGKATLLLKATLAFSFISFSPSIPSYASQQRPDSLISLINKDKLDTSRVAHLNNLCVVYCSTGKTDSAMKLGNQALILAQQINYPWGMGDAYNAIATAYFSLKDYNNALLTFQKALKIYEKLNSRGKEKAQAIIASIGYMYEAKGDYTHALEYYNKSLNRARTTGDKKELATAINNIGNVYNMQGNDAEAIKCYLKSLQLREQAGDKAGIIKSASNIGFQYRNQGNYAKAEQYYNKALVLSENIRDRALMASTSINLAGVYREDGDNVKALEYDYKALQLAEELQSAPLLASANSSIALIHWSQQDYSKARESYTTALSLARQTGDKSTQATILGNLGIVCETQGDYPNALDYDFQSLKLSRELRDTNGITVSTGNIGDIYIKQKNYKEAEKYILQALYLADTIHMMEEVKTSNLQLSQLFSQTGQWQKALDAYKQYAAASDSLSKETRNRAITRLRSKAEFDKLAALQNVNEDKEEQIESIRNRYRKIVEILVVFIVLVGFFTLWLIFRMQRTKEKRANKPVKREIEDLKE